MQLVGKKVDNILEPLQTLNRRVNVKVSTMYDFVMLAKLIDENMLVSPISLLTVNHDVLDSLQSDHQTELLHADL